jgi:hypothetical protein
MAVQIDLANFCQNPFSLYRRLTPDQQATLNDLTTEALIALTKKDMRVMLAVYPKVLDALVREGRAACTALGLAYPITEEWDAKLHQLLIDAWPSWPNPRGGERSRSCSSRPRTKGPAVS